MSFLVVFLQGQHLFGQGFGQFVVRGSVRGQRAVEQIGTSGVTHGSFLCGRAARSMLGALTAVER